MALLKQAIKVNVVIDLQMLDCEAVCALELLGVKLVVDLSCPVILWHAASPKLRNTRSNQPNVARSNPDVGAYLAVSNWAEQMPTPDLLASGPPLILLPSALAP